MSDKYEKLATKIGAVVDSKNKQYGNSFAQSGKFLKLIYPNGIPINAYTDALCIVRIFDKLKRLGNASNLPVNEGKLDAWQDIVGYALLGLQKDSEPLTVVKHCGFALDKNALGTVLTQPIASGVEIETEKEQAARRAMRERVEKLSPAEIEERQKQINLLATGHAVAAELARQKEVQSNIIKEIEKAKLKHDSTLPFVNEEHSTESHYEAVEVARKVVDDGKCAVCNLPVYGKGNTGDSVIHPGCLAEFYKDRQIVPEDLTLADIGSGGPKCAICQCPFRGPLSKEMLDSFAPMVHEECYRKHFGDSAV